MSLGYASSNLQTAYPFRSVGPLGSAELPFAFYVADLTTTADSSFVLASMQLPVAGNTLSAVIDGSAVTLTYTEAKEEGSWLLVQCLDLTLLLSNQILADFTWPVTLNLAADLRALTPQAKTVSNWKVKLSDALSYSTKNLTLATGYNRGMVSSSSRSLGVTKDQLTISGSGGDGLGYWSSCSAAFVTSICGVTADQNGNVDLTSKDCYSFMPVIGVENPDSSRDVSRGKLGVMNHCAPCLTCEDIDTVYVDGLGTKVTAATAAKTKIYAALASYKTYLAGLAVPSQLSASLRVTTSVAWGVTIQLVVVNNGTAPTGAFQVLLSQLSGPAVAGTGYGTLELADGTTTSITSKTFPMATSEIPEIPPTKSVTLTLACVAAPGATRVDEAAVSFDAVVVSDSLFTTAAGNAKLMKAYNKPSPTVADKDADPLGAALTVTQTGSTMSASMVIVRNPEVTADIGELGVSISDSTGGLIAWSGTVVKQVDTVQESVTYSGGVKVATPGAGSVLTLTFSGTSSVTVAAIRKFTADVTWASGNLAVTVSKHITVA